MAHRRSMLWVVVSALVAAPIGGCTLLVDGTISSHSGMDGGSTPDTGPLPDTGSQPDTGPLPDAGPASPCSTLPDGVHCTMTGIDEPFVCVSGVCELSRCGDGIVDDRMGSMHEIEECDDGNSTPGDGCDNDCLFTCIDNLDCVDGEDCNGTESCDITTHLCQAGSALGDGQACTVPGTSTMAVCHGGVCRAGMCGDGTLDAGEQCDDHNANDGDGCQHDCTFTCVDDSACQNGNACDGNETCNVATHVCVAATTPLDCDDMDACTNDSCDSTSGCVHASVLLDADMDGHFAITASCGGDDCNDMNASAYPGAPEPCGSAMDLNCDGSAGATPRWYADCDGDGYATSSAQTMTVCTPSGAPSACASGHWTTIAPATGTIDCLDSSSSAHPGQTLYYTVNASGLSPAFDYNCSGAASREYSYAASGSVPRGLTSTCAFDSRSNCIGDSWYVSSTAPTCGASTTLSYCRPYFGLPPLGSTCTRTTITTHTVRCH